MVLLIYVISNTGIGWYNAFTEIIDLLILLIYWQLWYVNKTEITSS